MELRIASFPFDALEGTLWKKILTTIFSESRFVLPVSLLRVSSTVLRVSGGSQCSDRMFWIGFIGDERRVSVLLRPEQVETLGPCGLLLDENVWTPLRLPHDIHSASCALARRSIPIYCITTFRCDYVLVPISQREEALSVLALPRSCASEGSCTTLFDRLHVSLHSTSLSMCGVSSEQFRSSLALPVLRSLLSEGLLEGFVLSLSCLDLLPLS